MRTFIFRWLLATCLIFVTASCSTKLRISAEQRGEVERTLVSKSNARFLRLSFFVTPFFGDASKRLLTPLPPEEVDWIAEPDGKPIPPGPVERVLPVGTKVKITKVEFPTGWAMSERLLYTPRMHPWVYLEVDGQALEFPIVLVLRPDTRDSNEFLAEVEQYLSVKDPRERMTQWSEATRTAVIQKAAVPDMPMEALEMAWGFPERKYVTYQNGVRIEDWVYPGNRRTAHLADGRLIKFQNDLKN